MVDALSPALGAYELELRMGGSLETAASGAREAAAEGMRGTIPLQARKGRASYLGPRSVGHQDPGATSTALMFAALEHAVIADRSQRFAGGARRPVSGSGFSRAGGRPGAPRPLGRARAARILKALGSESARLGVTELAERLGLAKATVYGLLRTLEAHQLVEQD